jgi:ribose/xylose/arabinose/galactoside ABC-type transport system permease subunit
MISGAFAGLAAAMIVAYQTGTNQTLGNMMEFNAIAACVVGGVVLGGGKGDPVSGFLGALLMALITNGLYKWGLSTGGTYVMQGIVILLAMNFDGQFNRISRKRLELSGRL